ncbi:MAG: hypothetical protein K0R02_859 [Rickettsiaceae bacterium]|jgi:aminoglycoside 6'-N-acetyltransferase|nr:hypothetical protein [Rickettsiaceae bacterium]
MTISFLPLQREHLPLLLKWLETPHVKAWWPVDQSFSEGRDHDVAWTPELIEEKYESYISGYKILKLDSKVITKPIHAYIICINGIEAGYIQFYNAHDFPREQGYETNELPQNCASIDVYIGEAEFIGKGFGPKSIEQFTNEYIFPKYDYVFVDPDTKNYGAIIAYEKCGFKIIKHVNNGEVTWMVKGRDKDA